jgi:two-component system response regulator
MVDERPLLLFAEDDHEDWMLIEETLAECNGKCDVERVQNGEELLKRLRDTEQPLPSVVMLDLKMPRMNGDQALQIIRNDDRLAHLPVVMMTTSKTEGDIFQAYRGGANSYVVKPVGFEDMKELLGKLHDYWFSTVELPRLPPEAT